MKASKGSDMLIIEGTGVSWPEEKHDENSEEFTDPKNEVELTEEIVHLQNENPERQITFNTYPTNVERMLRIIADSPRKVVLHAERAHLIKESLDEDYPYYYLPQDKKYSDLNPELEENPFGERILPKRGQTVTL